MPVVDTRKEKIFLDTAFLASFSIPHHRDYKKARKLLAELILKYDLYTSPLCFYELWQVVKEYNDISKQSYRFIRKLNRILRFIYLKILFKEINFSYKQVISDLRNFTNEIINSGFITNISLGSGNINLALDAIDKFDTKPGDAFHFSAITAQKISLVVTGNIRDFRRMGLGVIWL